MGAWSALIMGLFLFGGIRYFLGTMIAAGNPANDFLLAIVPVVGAVLVVGVLSGLFHPR